jgi:hypothetical protein
MNSNGNRDHLRNDRGTPVSTFRLPHEQNDGASRASCTSGRPVAPTVLAGNSQDAVRRVAERRTSARRTVSGLSVGLVVAAGVGVGGLTWAAQQARAGTTTAVSQTTPTDTTGTSSTGSTSATGTTATTSTTGTTTSSGAVSVTAVSGNANASTSAS